MPAGCAVVKKSWVDICKFDPAWQWWLLSTFRKAATLVRDAFF